MGRGESFCNFHLSDSHPKLLTRQADTDGLGTHNNWVHRISSAEVARTIRTRSMVPWFLSMLDTLRIHRSQSKYRVMFDLQMRCYAKEDQRNL
ncbi:hypothetical protein AFLA_005231 [Aspergillus flavus NRRL3357]|nr:hypothetical protein AFLA_005231 [Aspergillus flavus NRRL3357]